MRPQTVLVINVSRIGDTLLSTPSLRAMAAAWPEAKIDVLGHPSRIQVLECLPFLRWVRGISKRSAPFLGWVDRFTKHKPYDLAFVYGFDSALVRYAKRIAQHVVAFRQPDIKLNQGLGTVVEPPTLFASHAVWQTFSLPAALGIPRLNGRLSYSVTPDEIAWAKHEITNEASAGARPLIGIQVASFPTKAYRDWPIKSFMALCETICNQWPQAHFLIFGGAAEHERTEALKEKLGPAATLFAGRLSLRQTGALMSQLDLYIGVDTGPTHLMSAFDIPLVGLYHGYSRSELIGPLDHPCFYPLDHPLAGPDCTMEVTMADITVERAWKAVQQALQDHPPR